jgi:PadR family transcriptional regulator PadR
MYRSSIYIAGRSKRPFIQVLPMSDEELGIQELTKSCNEVLILAILAGGRKHGYQLALEIEERSGGYFRFNHGTLYPILHKLEKERMIEGKWKREGPKRRRKLYTLTRKGRKYYARQVSAWRKFTDHFFGFVDGGTK